MLAATRLAAAAEIRGVVVDQQDAAVPQAIVQWLSASGFVVKTAPCDGAGAFRFQEQARGAYELAVSAPGFETTRRRVRIDSATDAIQLQVRLAIGAVSESVTVTTAPGLVENTLETAQPVNVVRSEDVARRPGLLFPQVFREEAGVHVQQTSGHQGTVFLRGLTGQRVITLIDGVRFNNATFRNGPNQYQALIAPGSLERVEVARGPSGVQYGSDSLGGTINALTRRQAFQDTGVRIAGSLGTLFGTADLAGGGDAELAISNRRSGLRATGSGHRINDLRAGGGIDSHAAATRYLGLSSRELGTRLQDTAFSSFGGTVRVALKFGGEQHFSTYYARNEQHGGRRYDLMNGGNGQLYFGFSPQGLDFWYGRWERRAWGWLDSLTATVSRGRIRDDRQTQTTELSPLILDFESTRSAGYQLQATSHAGARNVFGFGAEVFDERVRARLYRQDRLTGVATELQRPRFPDRSAYRTSAAYWQDTVELWPRRWRLTGGIRYSAFRYRARSADNPVDPAGRPTVVDADFRTDDFTYHSGTSFFLTPQLSLNAVFSRGFRAPNINDLGQIGLTSSGYEIAPDDALRLGGRVGTTADASARAAAGPMKPLRPESLLNYEGGVKFRNERASAEASFFVADIHDFITKRAVILPPGVVGQRLGFETISFQDAAGWVRVPLDGRPVATRFNAVEIRIAGIELAQHVRLSSVWSLHANFFYLRARDKNPAPPAPQSPGVPSIRKAPDAPDLEGGFPPASGYASLRYRARSRWWIELASKLAWRQETLSSLDLADQRIGAARSRSDIASYFNNGARTRGLVANGLLAATGETLAQVQDRVLGPGVISAPWFLSTPGYAILHVRYGIDLTERSSLTLLVENLLDRNYRAHGSGIDGPGVHVQVHYKIRF